MLIANESNYRNLSKFENVEQLNEAIRSHRSAHELKPTELAVLDVLAHYSCKYPGVSFLTKNKIAEIIGKSRRTVIRVCLRLESLGIIKQYEMKRTSDMQQTSNAIVICLVEVVVTQDKPENVTPLNSDSINSKTVINNTYSETSRFDSPYVAFKRMINNFIDDKKLVNRLYGIYLAHSSYMRSCYDEKTLLEAGLYAIKTTFQASKRKAIANVPGYFNNTLDRLLDRLHYEETYSAMS